MRKLNEQLIQWNTGGKEVYSRESVSQVSNERRTDGSVLTRIKVTYAQRCIIIHLVPIFPAEIRFQARRERHFPDFPIQIEDGGVAGRLSCQCRFDHMVEDELCVVVFEFPNCVLLI